MVLVVSFVLAVIGSADPSAGGPVGLTGVVRDDTGAVLPAAAVTVRKSDGRIIASTVSDDTGRYRLDSLTAGIYVVEVALPNFGTRRFAEVRIDETQVRTLDATLSLTISADVSVTAKRSFRNLAEIDSASGGLIGIADTASEGLATGRQLDARPIARVSDADLGRCFSRARGSVHAMGSHQRRSAWRSLLVRRRCRKPAERRIDGGGSDQSKGFCRARPVAE
jgi:Carboxypeptidase regulatory-like domain